MRLYAWVTVHRDEIGWRAKPKRLFCFCLLKILEFNSCNVVPMSLRIQVEVMNAFAHSWSHGLDPLDFFSFHSQFTCFDGELVGSILSLIRNSCCDSDAFLSLVVTWTGQGGR